MNNPHGGNLHQWRSHYPQAPQPWLELSTGVSPWAYPFEIDRLREISSALPDAEQFEKCRQAMAAALRCNEKALLPVAGTELVLRLLPFITKRPLVISTPTYGDYATAWRLAGYPVQQLTAITPENMPAAHCVIVCNPNNPDGRHFERHRLLELVRVASERGSVLIVDEAYGDLSPKHAVADIAGEDHLIVLRSFGKFFGLPGIRLGAVIAETGLLAALQARLGHWHVSSIALAVGAQAYGDQAWHDKHRERLRVAAKRLADNVKRIGLPLLAGTDLFLTIDTGNASGLWDHLMRAGIYTRQFDEAPHLLRIGLPADSAQEQRLLTALRLYSQRNTGHHQINTISDTGDSLV